MAGGRTKRETKPGTASSAASATWLRSQACGLTCPCHSGTEAPGLSREDALQSLQQAFETLKALPQGPWT